MTAIGTRIATATVKIHQGRDCVRVMDIDGAASDTVGPEGKVREVRHAKRRGRFRSE